VTDSAGFTCPRCGRTSYHPEDIREGYCGACRDWTGRAAAGELGAQAVRDIDAIVTALAPLADAYLHTAERVGDMMAEWGRQVTAAFMASHGAREGRGDPTGDGPVGRGDG